MPYPHYHDSHPYPSPHFQESEDNVPEDSSMQHVLDEAALLHPPFPDELHPRVLLLIKAGQLVQVSSELIFWPLSGHAFGQMGQQ
jgi:hypothetical protein